MEKINEDVSKQAEQPMISQPLGQSHGGNHMEKNTCGNK